MSIIHQIGLSLVKNVGHITAKNLLKAFGTAEAVFRARIPELLAVPGVGSGIANALKSGNALKEAERDLLQLQKRQIKALFYTDQDYPSRLRECYDAPIVLYYRGNANLNPLKVVSIVGTRKASAYGRTLCKELLETLKAHDVLIVSGLAFGIDVAAHQESLNHGVPTVGILGHGLDRVYPGLHQPIAGKMLEQGGLLTEFPLFTNPDKENFPKRNRIIAGMADVTVVVEAALKGGALITAELAGSYNRDVFAFPGRTTDPYSQGCNFLIKTNRAGLINDPDDLIRMMGWEGPLQQPAKQLHLSILQSLSVEERQIIDFLQVAPARIDQIAQHTQIRQSTLTMHLLSLEMQGLVVVAPGQLYKQG